jgi:hypothetical protein
MAAESTKRIKNQVVEPELCVVCSDRFTSIVRKKTTCTYCKASACSKCVEHYLLTRHEDAHCLHCRVNYNDTTLHEICTRTYLQQTYFKHRQEVLINRERANLPPLQEAAHREKATREIQAQVNAICAEISAFAAERAKLMERYQIVYVDYYRNLNTHPERLAEMNRLMAQSDELRTRMREKRDMIHSLRWPPQARQAHERAAEEEKKEDEKKRFVRRCTRDGCKGFLSTAWKCGMCEWYSCSKCFAVKGKEHDVAHECKKEDVETADLIRKDCKPCPKCGEFIEKTSGCFALDTPILMWDGSIKMSQDIRIGDELVGDDGTKRTVQDTVTGEDTMYEVIQTTGMNYTVNSKHTLLLKFTCEKKIYWKERECAWELRWLDRTDYKKKTKRIAQTDTKTKEDALRELEEFRDTLDFPEEIEILVDKYMTLKDTVKNSLVGYKSEGIQWEKKPVPLDPYMMGLYLGDGINDGMSFAINAPEDPEILEYILEWAEQNHCEVVHDDIYRFRIRRCDNKNNKQKAIGRGATSETCKGCKTKKSGFCDRPNVPYAEEHHMARKNPFREIIEKYGMVGDKKKIPQDYLVNDRESRLRLLAGIIDTDGHLNKMNDGKRIGIVSSQQAFANQVVLLSRSLGFPTTIHNMPKKGIAFSKGGEKKDYDDHYAINISGKISAIPTRVARKKCCDSSPNRDGLKTSIVVEERGRGTYFGWKVDGNHRFVLSDVTSIKNCSQMYCVCCQTPWDWITGKIVTSGPIHNPHYYEWLKRTGGAVPRNPNDVPCGGFPGAWELVRHPRGMKRHVSNLFYEFHRICMELQDISTRTYRSHLDQEGTTRINIGFLLGDTDEKKWGRLLATNEKKRKRDAEIQEVLGAFRMVAVELINRVQNYSEKGVLSFYHMHPLDAEKYIKALHVEITALINMINDAMKNISASYSYSVPCIMSEWSDREDTVHYFIRTKNLAMEARRKRREDKELAEEIAQEKEEEKEEKQEEKEEEVEEEPPRGEYLEDMGEQLQRAIIASLQE